MTTDEIKKIEEEQVIDTHVDNGDEDIDVVLNVFDNDRDATAAHSEPVYVDDPAKYAREQVKMNRQPKREASPAYIGPATIKRAKRIARMIVFWLCIASCITTTASIVLGSWMVLKPEGLLFTVGMVILAMGITLLFTQLYACIKEAIDTSC